MFNTKNKMTSFFLFALLMSLGLLSLTTFAKTSDTPLFKAIKSGDIQKVKQLIVAGEDVDTIWTYKDKSKGTPLLLAIEKNNVEMVRLLITNNADVNLHNKYAITNEWTQKWTKSGSNYPIIPVLSASLKKHRSISENWKSFLAPDKERKKNLLIIRLLADNRALVPFHYTYGLVEDGMGVCGAIASGSFKKLQNYLMEDFNLKVEEAYLLIECSDNDLMRMVVDEPTNRIELAVGLMRYFKKKLKKPELFSKALLNRNNSGSKDTLRTIELSLAGVRRNDDLAGNEYEERLVYMQNRYIKWLIKYPVPGSAEVVNEHKKYLIKNYFPKKLNY